MINIDEKFYEIIKKGEKPSYYHDWYDKIITDAKKRGSNKKILDYYTEEHHILPKCLGGKDESSNLVLLTAKEHIIIHILLHREYPENSKLAHAANCMILLRNSEERSKEIDLVDLDTLSELRELSGKLLRKAIVCFTKEIDPQSLIEVVTVCKIYDSISDTENDGFNKSCIHKAEKEEKTYCGYFWLKLTEAEEVIPQAILEYRDKMNTGELLGNIYHEKRKQNSKRNEQIICFKDGIVFRIYDRLSDCSKDGFCLHNVSTVLNGRRSEHFGYCWAYKSDFMKSEINVNLLNSFLNNDNIPELTFPSNKIICCSEKNDILRIYNKLSDVVFDGFSKGNISTLLNKVGSGVLSGGFYWYKYDDWEDKSKLVEFQLLLESGKLPKLKNRSIRLISPSIIIKCNDSGDIDEIYKNLIDLEKTDYSLGKIRNIFNNNNNITIEDINVRKYKEYFWFRVSEFNKLFPGKIDEYLYLENINESLEKSETVLNLVLTVSSKLISVNELYKAKIITKGGRTYPTLYKNPKAVKVSEEIRNQLLSVDFSKYIKWLSKTKKYFITINFVLKSGISQRDCANFEKIMCDDLVKFIKNDLGITHFDDSEFLEVRLIKSIIPNAKNEYALIQLKESKHDIRFDHVDTPEKIYLAGPSFPNSEFNWKDDISPYILSTSNLTFYDPSTNFLDSDTRSIEKYHNCNTILYMLYPTIFEQMPDICSRIMKDLDFILEEGNHSFLWIGILGESDVWGDYSDQVTNLYNYINKHISDCSRIRIKYIEKPEEILKP